jgi:hypothetical protein
MKNILKEIVYTAAAIGAILSIANGEGLFEVFGVITLIACNDHWIHKKGILGD